MLENQKFDVIIIGGSYAGLSAAMSLGRSLRKVLIIDSGLPCNKQTPHSHNFITQDGETPNNIAKKAREQVLKYDTITLLDAVAVKGVKAENNFLITTDKNEIFEGKKIIFATGIKDHFPSIENFSDCWGISVIHCPYCHGYEVAYKKTAILANGEKAMHIASLVNNLTKDLTILTNGEKKFTDEQLSKLIKHNIPIIEKEITEIIHENGSIKNIIYKDNTSMSFEVMYAPLSFSQNSNIPNLLGCELDEQGYIKTNDLQQTTVKGIWACGDNTKSMRSVANAVASGNLTGAMVNKELIDEEF
ncbi:NAD(P)/FAD-dependent oxidoreductase [Chishuiella sp.]|uniref:NAD(P)/FAD-dependent oxidoreductase n=1 Tax=Chishuiella sp. TaxID=1969467 RepID=UPI0028B14625|nr:NAD(P)/FAD-dependent oxidoreductase [Chishuiella sp.]